MRGWAFAQMVVFTDSFTPGPSQLWNNLRGAWIGTNGGYYAQLPSNNPLTYTAIPFNFTDCSIDVDINAVADGGVWMRSDEIGENGILLVTGGNFWGGGARGGGAGTSIYWHNVVGGQYGPKLNEVLNVITNPGVQTIHLRVEVAGNTYSAFLNGSTNPVTTLTSATYGSGRIALYDFSSQTFSNAVVKVPTNAVQGPFSLSMTNLDAQHAALFWSTNANSFYLESTPSLSPSFWTLVTNRPAISNEQFVVPVVLTNSAQFFRLHY